MKSKRIKSLLYSGDHDNKTVKEFAQLIDAIDADENFDIDVWANDSKRIFDEMMGDIFNKEDEPFPSFAEQAIKEHELKFHGHEEGE